MLNSEINYFIVKNSAFNPQHSTFQKRPYFTASWALWVPARTTYTPAASLAGKRRRAMPAAQRVEHRYGGHGRDSAHGQRGAGRVGGKGEGA